jgi:hypothetical protein
LKSYRQAGLSSLYEAAVINAIDVGVAGLLLLAFRIPFFDSFGLILLIEAAALLLVGGAMGFTGQPGVRKVGRTLGIAFRGRISSGLGEKNKTRQEVVDDVESMRLNDMAAALYMLAGVILFVESALLTVVFATGA